MRSGHPHCMLFVFAWLVVGDEETEVRLLAKHLNPAHYQLVVVACLRKPGMSEQSQAQLAALGIPVDTTPYDLPFDETVAYLAQKLPHYDKGLRCGLKASWFSLSKLEKDGFADTVSSWPGRFESQSHDGTRVGRSGVKR
jgi:hypothetical protein